MGYEWDVDMGSSLTLSTANSFMGMTRDRLDFWSLLGGWGDFII